MNRETLKKARTWCARQFAKRYDHDSHPGAVAADIMHEAEGRFPLGTYGVEGWAASMYEGVQYLNTGDTYGTTILCRTDRNSARFSVGAWGDVAEKMAR